MDTVRSGGERWIGLSLFGHVFCNRHMYVDHHFDSIRLLQDPLAITLDDIIVAFIHREPCVLFFTSRFDFVRSTKRFGIEWRWSQQNQLGTRRMHLVDQTIYPVLVSLKPVFSKWIIDSIIHAVASNNDIGLEHGKCSIEPFMDIRPGEWMIGLGQPRACFTRQPKIDNLWQRIDPVQSQLRFNPRDVSTSIRYRITKENNSFSR